MLGPDGRPEGQCEASGLRELVEQNLHQPQPGPPVAPVQNHFHVNRQQDPGLLGECEASEIGFAPFFPLGGGPDPLDAGRLEPVAKRHAATVAQAALAYLLARSRVMLAIPGTGSVEHLEENMGAGRIDLTPEDMAELEAQR